MMRPRKDFGVLHNRAITDSRFDSMGAALVRLKMALPITAPDTARALAQRLWIYLLRLNDRTGVLPGDGIQVARSAFGVGPAEAAALLTAMTKADLLVMENGRGLRCRGFEETYEPLYRERDRDMERKSRGVSRGKPDGKPAATVAVAVAVAGSEEETTAKSETKAPCAQDAAHTGTGEKKRVDRSTPVERLLREKGITLSDRGGCGITAWRKQLRAATAAGAPDQEVADAIEASSPLDKPWDAIQPATNRYGRQSRRDPRGFRIPAGAQKPPPGESFGEGIKANWEDGPGEEV